MTKMNLKILQIVSRIAFGSFIGIFIISIFYKPWTKILVASCVWLFFVALTFEVLYQLLSGRKEAKKIKVKKSAFKNLPAGFYIIKDNKTNAPLGELSNDNVDFLRKRFLDQGMDDNEFYFLSETLEMFLKQEKPDQKLTDFLNTAMKSKNEIELHWEPLKHKGD